MPKSERATIEPLDEINTQSFDLIPFEELQTTTSRSSSSSHTISHSTHFSEPLEIIRSSVIVSQNHRKNNNNVNENISQKFLGNSIARSPKSVKDESMSSPPKPVRGSDKITKDKVGAVNSLVY